MSLGGEPKRLRRKLLECVLRLLPPRPPSDDTCTKNANRLCCVKLPSVVVRGERVDKGDMPSDEILEEIRIILGEIVEKVASQGSVGD